jgi:hypothetical protein
MNVDKLLKPSYKIMNTPYVCKIITSVVEMNEDTLIPHNIYTDFIVNSVKELRWGEKYEIKIRNEKYEIYIFNVGDKKKENSIKNQKIVEKIINAINLLNSIRDLPQEQTERTIKAYLYLLPHKKKKPILPSQIFTPEHVNSGFTYEKDISSDNNIYIYREEEYMRLILHELCHVFRLDKKYHNVEYNEKVNKLFNLEPKTLVLYETFTEVTATIFNIIIYSYFKLETESPTKSYKKFKQNYLKLYKTEEEFILIQVSKVLDIKRINYNDLIYDEHYKKPQIKNETNIFSYILLKALVMYKLEYYLDEILNINILNRGKKTTKKKSLKSAKHRNIYDIIKKNYNSKKWKDKLKVCDKKYKKIMSGNDDYLKKTMRFTITE